MDGVSRNAQCDCIGHVGLHTLLGLSIVLAPQSAQAATYVYTPTTFSYVTSSAGASTAGWHNNGKNPGCTRFPNGDDDWADVAFPNGFRFRVGGASYSGVRINSNGIWAYPPDVSGFHRTFTS